MKCLPVCCLAASLLIYGCDLDRSSTPLKCSEITEATVTIVLQTVIDAEEKSETWPGSKTLTLSAADAAELYALTLGNPDPEFSGGSGLWAASLVIQFRDQSGRCESIGIDSHLQWWLPISSPRVIDPRPPEFSTDILLPAEAEAFIRRVYEQAQVIENLQNELPVLPEC